MSRDLLAASACNRKCVATAAATIELPTAAETLRGALCEYEAVVLRPVSVTLFDMQFGGFRLCCRHRWRLLGVASRVADALRGPFYPIAKKAPLSFR
jgi:hypothetical protein